MVCTFCSCKDISGIYCRTFERLVAFINREICKYFYGDFVLDISVKKYLAFEVNVQVRHENFFFESRQFIDHHHHHHYHHVQEGLGVVPVP
jgi:hypothetical protein